MSPLEMNGESIQVTSSRGTPPASLPLFAFPYEF